MPPVPNRSVTEPVLTGAGAEAAGRAAGAGLVEAAENRVLPEPTAWDTVEEMRGCTWLTTELMMESVSKLLLELPEFEPKLEKPVLETGAGGADTVSTGLELELELLVNLLLLDPTA